VRQLEKQEDGERLADGRRLTVKRPADYSLIGSTAFYSAAALIRDLRQLHRRRGVRLAIHYLSINPPAQ
jgi:hypothetical protein